MSATGADSRPMPAERLTTSCCHVAVAARRRAVARHVLRRQDAPAVVPINAPAERLTSLFGPGAVDLVTLVDVLEHFAPEDARVVLSQAEAVAALLARKDRG
jgi:hypothetical protein